MIDVNGKYWWFRMEASMWESDYRIITLENENNGYELFTIYIKLLTISVKDNNKLCIPVVNNKPMFMALSSRIRHRQESLIYALKLFLELGLMEEIKVCDNELVYDIPILSNIVGRSSVSADIKRLKRNKEKNLEALEALEDRESENIKSYGIYNNVYLTDIEYKELKELYNDVIVKDNINILSIQKKKINNLNVSGDKEKIEIIIKGIIKTDYKCNECGKALYKRVMNGNICYAHIFKIQGKLCDNIYNSEEELNKTKGNNCSVFDDNIPF